MRPVHIGHHCSQYASFRFKLEVRKGQDCESVMGHFIALTLTYRNGPLGFVRFSRRLCDALGLGHVFMGMAVSKARTCSLCVYLITPGVKMFIRVPILC
jgi:hypothetical protein